MRTTTILTALAILLLVGATAWAQAPGQPQDGNHGFCRFIDENGDGFNDLAPDDDGDGIPNGMDPDWRPQGHGRGVAEHFRAGPFGYGPMAAQHCFGGEMDGEQWNEMMQHMGEGGHMMGMGGGMMGFGPGTGTGDHEGCDQPGTGWMEHRGGMHGGDGGMGGGHGGGMGGGHH